MDLSLARAAMPFSSRRRRRRWLLLLAALGVTGYGAYRAYHHPAIAEKRRRLGRLLRALASLVEAVSASAETVGIVSNDLNRFLRGDSGEIPRSLMQISRLAASEDIRGAVARVSEALTAGVLRGASAAAGGSKPGEGAGPSATDLALDKILSPAGSGFASAVVGSFARNLVIGFYDAQGDGTTPGGSNGPDDPPVPSWVPILCNGKVRMLIGDCIQAFVSTAVTVYLEKTMDLNTFDEMFAGITNPKHEAKVKDVLVSVCSGAVETLVKTSHKVMTSPPPISAPSTDREEEGEEYQLPARGVVKAPLGAIDGGWAETVSSTLAVPSNRRFVLDLTGRVTSESVRSFLDYMVCNLFNGAKNGVEAIRGEIAMRGLEVMRYASAKSLVVLTVCFAICLRIAMSGSRSLLSATPFFSSSTEE